MPAQSVEDKFGSKTSNLLRWRGMRQKEGKMIQSYTLLGMLGWCSFEDFRKKRILVYPVLLFGIAGVLLHLYYRNISIGCLLAGCAIGMGLLLLSCLTGQIGAGDALVLIVSGIYLGFWENTRLFFHGLIFCGIWSLALLALKRKRRRDEVAFIPFLFLAYLEMLVL